MTSPVPTFSDPAEAAAFAQYREAQIEEYGTYIAAGDILVGNAPAFAAGHPVPKSTAEAMGWVEDGTVVPAGSALPVPPNRAAQLRARREELERERHAIELELSVADRPGNYAAKTVVELREELAGRELSTSGNKAELVARLEAADSAASEGEGE